MESDRHVHVLRQVRSPVEGTAGQAGNHHEGTCRKERDTGKYIATLGVWSTLTGQRELSRSCRSPRSQNGQTLSRKITGNGKNLENFGKIFFAETLENIESGGFSERISTFFAEFCPPPIAKLANGSYNRRYKEWGKCPTQIKTGLESAINTRKPLTPNLKPVDLVLSENILPTGNLSIASTQHPLRKSRR